MMEDVLGIAVQIHPVALFTIVDSYERRQEQGKRVIGTLLGSKDKPGITEIRSGYAVPHNETEEEVQVDMDFDREMIKLHQKVNCSETIMGWYSTFAISDRPKYTTSPENMMHSVLIHEYYCRLDSNAVFVTVDTTLRSGRLDIKAYVRSKVGLPGKTEGVIFTPVPCEVVYFEPEKVGVDLLLSTTETQNCLLPVISDFSQIGRAADLIDQTLGKLLKYIDSVIAGEIPPNGTVGRLLMETVSRVPRIEGAKFESMLNSTMQDLLMVVYLADLTKTQVILGERLTQLPS